MLEDKYEKIVKATRFKLTSPDISEWREQAEFIKFVGYQYPKYSKLLYHIANQACRTVGEGMKLKRMGRKSGVPDLCFPISRMGFHALYIEMKKCGNLPPTDEEIEFMRLLMDEGCFCVVAHGWEKAKKIFEHYLNSNHENILEWSEKGYFYVV